ncbi:hypothetical protein HDU91_005321 [Kappamyces sp. JEL0680]|nr:hypothetical protein HDU91_005321 [Kappamyces sp. JEL0680]
MSSNWFDANSLGKNFGNLATKVSTLAQEALQDLKEEDDVREQLEALRKERDELKSRLMRMEAPVGGMMVTAAVPSRGAASAADEGSAVDAKVKLASMEIEMQSEREEFQTQLHELQLQLNLTQEKAKQKEDELNALLTRVKTLAGDKIKKLLAQTQELTTERDSLKHSLAAQAAAAPAQSPGATASAPDAQELVALESQLEAKENERQRLLAQLEQLDQMHQQELEELGTTLQQQAKSLKDALAREAAQALALAAVEEKLEQMALQSTRDHDEAATLQEQVDQLQHDKQTLQQQVEELTHQASFSTKDSHSRESQADLADPAAADQQSRLRADVARLQEQLAAEKEKNMALEETISILEVEGAQETAPAADPRLEEIPRLEKRLEQALHELELVKQENLELSHTIAVLQAEAVQSADDTAAGSKDELIAQLQQLLDQEKAANGALQASQRDLEDRLCQHDRLQNQLHDLDNELASVRNELQMAQQTNRTLEETVEVMKAQASATEMNSVLSDQMESLARHIDTLEGQVHAERDRNHELEETIAALETQVAASVPVAATESRVDELQALADQLQGQLSSKALEELELKQAHAAQVAELEQQSAQQHSVIQELQAKLELAQTNLSQQELDLAQRHEAQAAQILELKEQLAIETARVPEIDPGMAEKTLLLEALVTEKEGEISRLQTLLADASSSHEDVQSQLESLRSQLENAHQELSFLQSNEATQRDSGRSALLTVELGETIQMLQHQVEEHRNQSLALQQSTAELQALVENLSHENQVLDSERKALNEKLESFKVAVTGKIQQEIEESDRLRQQLADSAQQMEQQQWQIQELTAQLSSQDNNDALQESSREIQYLQEKTVELLAQVQKGETELNRLRAYLMEVEEASTQETLTMQESIQEYQRQIQILEKEREEWQGVSIQEQEARKSEADLLLDTKSQVALLLEEKASLGLRIEQDGKIIRNLQSVLSQFEACKPRLLTVLAKEQDIEDAVLLLQRSLKEAETRAQSYQQELQQTRSRVAELENNTFTSAPLEKELAEKTALIGQLRHDIVQLQSHLSEAMRYMKQGTAEDGVDRKLISNLLIGFVTAKYGDPKRFEILSVIGSILKLSEDEKAKVGLIRQPGSAVSPKPASGPTSPAEVTANGSQ